MKYKNFHIDKPLPNTPLYFIGPNATELLGWYLGGTWFEDTAGRYRNYYAKFWRELAESEMLLVTSPPRVEVRTKRKYTRNKDIA